MIELSTPYQVTYDIIHIYSRKLSDKKLIVLKHDKRKSLGLK